ncbi:MAG: hypothetical protein DRP97_08225, partial [Candidatus Latescibacterota bacterium]
AGCGIRSRSKSGSGGKVDGHKPMNALAIEIHGNSAQIFWPDTDPWKSPRSRKRGLEALDVEETQDAEK